MDKIGVKTMKYFLIILLTLFFFGCEEAQNNSDPIIEQITFSPIEPNTGSVISIRAICTDPDGDSLEYNWISSAGSFQDDAIGNPIDFIPNSIPQEYEITCIVNDRKGITEKTITFNVVERLVQIYGYVYDEYTDDPLIGVDISILGVGTKSIDFGYYEINEVPSVRDIQLIAEFSGYYKRTLIMSTTYSTPIRQDLYLRSE